MPEPYQLAQHVPSVGDAERLLDTGGSLVTTLVGMGTGGAVIGGLLILLAGWVAWLFFDWLKGRRRKNGGSTSSLIDALNNVAESQTATAESLAAMAAQIEGLREDLAEDRQRQTGRDERIAKALTVLLTHKTESRIAA